MNEKYDTYKRMLTVIFTLLNSASSIENIKKQSNSQALKKIENFQQSLEENIRQIAIMAMLNCPSSVINSFAAVKNLPFNTSNESKIRTVSKLIKEIRSDMGFSDEENFSAIVSYLKAGSNKTMRTMVSLSSLSVTVAHPDCWGDKQLVEALIKSDNGNIEIGTDPIILKRNVTDFPDIEFDEEGRRLLSLIDLI